MIYVWRDAVGFYDDIRRFFTLNITAAVCTDTMKTSIWSPSGGGFSGCQYSYSPSLHVRRALRLTFPLDQTSASMSSLQRTFMGCEIDGVAPLAAVELLADGILQTMLAGILSAGRWGVSRARPARPLDIELGCLLRSLLRITMHIQTTTRLWVSRWPCIDRFLAC